MKRTAISSFARLAMAAVIATFMMLSVSSAQAQEAGAHKYSLSLGVPGGGNLDAPGAAGLWMMMSPQLNLGLNLGLAWDSEADPGYDILLAPSLRYYFAQMGPVAPFYYGSLLIRIVDTDDDSVQVGAAGGLGAEWFVTDVFSLAGWTGLGIALVRVGDGIGIGTLTSGFSAQIYWD